MGKQIRVGLTGTEMRGFEPRILHQSMKTIIQYKAEDGRLFDDIDECRQYEDSKRNKTIWKLLKDIPGARAGTVFIHDKNDRVKGSPGCGCLKLAWQDGNVQPGYCNYCAECIVFPGQLAAESEWFTQIQNPIVTSERSVRKGKPTYYA